MHKTEERRDTSELTAGTPWPEDPQVTVVRALEAGTLLTPAAVASTFSLPGLSLGATMLRTRSE
jgi:hypothetical protein